MASSYQNVTKNKKKKLLNLSYKQNVDCLMEILHVVSKLSWLVAVRNTNTSELI